MSKILLILVLLLQVPRLAQGQDSDVPFNGSITDAAGKGIKAKITVLRDNSYTIADKKGKFGLTNIAPDDTLQIRYKAQTLEIPVAGRHSLRIVWIADSPSIKEDSELVDNGFEYIKRREYTDSSSGISGESMRRKGFRDLQSAVLSMVPGVQLLNGEITIRGINSINAVQKILIICDGMPISHLNNLNINDVESVEVQKGSNMYGLRGAAGVIIIRTRH